MSESKEEQIKKGIKIQGMDEVNVEVIYQGKVIYRKGRRK